MHELVLIVEDDVAINTLISEALTGADIASVSAFSGSEASMLLQANNYSCVILDLMLPGMTGQEVLTQIRAQGHTPVIVLSARVDKPTKLDLLHSGADDYVTKPFDVDELVARVRAQLRRFQAQPEAATVLSHLDITLDPETRQVTVDGSQVDLTTLEFGILELLLGNPRKVFTRANIYESVWGREFIDDEGTVNVHVHNLRTKLNQASANNHIITIWGVGFRLAGDV